ncbi:MAG: ParB/RepB/Spo0J family partition protein [Verrucomicrobia bacterium]|nr:ParB/RepB/Spo0J family partition protein [Verrucomicrobiota bacterium]
MTTQPDIRRIPLTLLKPTEHNPRVIVPDDPRLTELAASIRAHGQLQPGICRPHPTQQGAFELLAGCRRWWGCQLAGLDDMLVTVAHLDDRSAVEVTVLENLQREDLTPMEEAAGIRTLVKSGATAQEIAAKIGKPWSWVVRRERLNQLSPAWRKELAKPASLFVHFSAAHLELIARYDVPMQERLLKELECSLYNLPRSVQQLAAQLDEFQAKLSKAPWSLDDATLLPKAGACSTCPKRSSCSPGLFDDLPNPSPKDDRCLDVKCFEAKMKAHLARRYSELREEHPDAIMLSRGFSERAPRAALSERDVTKAKKGEKGARPALVVTGTGKGSVTWVKVKPDARQPATLSPEMAAKQQAQQEKQQREMGYRKALAELVLKAEVPPGWNVEIALAAESVGYYDIVSLVNVCSTCPTEKEVKRLVAEAWSEVRKRLASELQNEWCRMPQTTLKRIATLCCIDLPPISKN